MKKKAFFLFALFIILFSCSNDEDCLRAKLDYIEHYLESVKTRDNNVMQNEIRDLQYEAGLAKFDC